MIIVKMKKKKRKRKKRMEKKQKHASEVVKRKSNKMFVKTKLWFRLKATCARQVCHRPLNSGSENLTQLATIRHFYFKLPIRACPKYVFIFLKSISLSFIQINTKNV